MFPWFKVVSGGLTVLLIAILAIDAFRRGDFFEESGSDVEVATVDVVHKGNVAGKVYVRVRPEGLAVRELQKTQDEVVAQGRELTPEREAMLAGKKLIALTFDDGPSYATTPRLLDVLKEKNAKVTFFVIGKMAQAAPELLQCEEQEGHAVGSHTMGHVDLSKLDAVAIRQDFLEINGVFQGALGRGVGLTRPPYGAISETAKMEMRQPLVIWSIDPEDWRTKDAEATRKHVTERAFDGAIVLMHDIYDSTVDAVGGMIDELRQAGYEFVTVPEMAQARGVALTMGEVYGSFRP